MRLSFGFLAALLALSAALTIAPTANAAPKKARASTKLSQKRDTAKKSSRVSRSKQRVAKKVAATKTSKRKRATRIAGAPKRYQRWFSGVATAYVPIDTLMEGGRWTCTMRDGWATKGVAVDPRQIPLGSLLYIPGYGRALADDTGGRIKGRHVDVRLHSVAGMHRWGVKKVKIYVLRGPAKKKARRLAA